MRFRAIIGAVALLLGAAGTAAPSGKTIVERDDEALAPFLWNWMDEVTLTEQGLAKSASKKDPLRPFFLAFNLLVTHERTGDPEALKAATRALDFMLDQYEPAERSDNGYRWFYGFDYGENIKAPWWSGMDGFFGPMTLYAAYQVTGNERYRDVAIKSAHLMLENPTKRGVVWPVEGGCWISEYSWTGMEQEDEYFVMNGNLWGLQALFLLQEASNDANLAKSFSCARDGTIARLDQHRNKNNTWSVYMTNGNVINPTHYNAIEIAQFRALWRLTGTDAFRAAAEQRAQFFKAAYPLNLVRSKEGYEVRFSMMGAPSPYWTDTYPVTVACFVNGEEVSATQSSVYDKTKSLSERLLLKLPVDSIPTTCRVSINSNVSVHMYDQDEFHESAPSLDASIAAAATASLLARSTDQENTFEAAFAHEDDNTDEARITVPLNAHLGPSDTLALVVHSEMSTQLGAYLWDQNGNSAGRYYPLLEAGKDNLVLFNVLGFENGDLLTGDIKELSLRIYKGSNKENFKVTVKDVGILRNAIDIEEFMQKYSGSHFPQQ